MPAGRAAGRLHKHYSSIQREFQIEVGGDYDRLVVPNGNGQEPIHRWFRIKEGFSHRLLPRVLKDLELCGRPNLRILDPFVGSGTTAISAADLSTDGTLINPYVLGYECNPFLHLVGDTKLRAIQKPSPSFLPLAMKLAAQAARDRIEPAERPTLSTLNNSEYFNEQDLVRLLQLRRAIDVAETEGAEPLDVDLALLSLGATIEPVSALRRDGRALRFTPEKTRANAVAEFLRRSEQIADDMPARATRVRGRIQKGDGCSLSPRPPGPSSIDLALFSPPYPNNIDYTEVYKMEAWLLGFIGDADEFVNARLQTVYSHPSINREIAPSDVPGRYREGVSALIEPLLSSIPDDKYARGRRSMLTGYVQDILTTLAHTKQALRPGGSLVYVVGNSLHGAGSNAFVVAADLLIAQLAKLVGLRVSRLVVARQLSRRGASSSTSASQLSEFLRESVVFITKPGRERRGSS